MMNEQNPMENEEITVTPAEETKAEETVVQTVETTETPVEKKPAKAFNKRRFRYGSNATALIAVVVAGVILLNVLVGLIADKFPITLDLSSDKVFTMSDESVAIAKALDKDVQIVTFLSEEFFSNSTTGANNGVPEYDTAMKEYHAMLQQLRTQSGGHISFTFIDPDQEPTKFAAYQEYDVTSGSILFIADDSCRNVSVEDLYALNSDSYSGGYSFTSKVEKTLAANINSLSSGSTQTVMALVGHEEDENVLEGLKELYEVNGYAFENIVITGSAPFNDDANVMIIPAPNNDYTEAEIKRVQEWVYNNGNYGHHLMVFTSSTASCPNLFTLLQVEYQIRVTDDLIWETDISRVQNYSSIYPVCDIPQTEFTKNSVSTGKVFSPQARRLETTLEAKNEESTVDTYGVALTNYPETSLLIPLESLSQENVDVDSVVYTPNETDYPLTSMIACVMNGYNNDTEQATNGTVVVCGCPFIAYGEISTSTSWKNEDLLLDTVNGITGTEERLSVSNKKLTNETLSVNGGTQLLLGIGVFVVGLPLLMLIICLVVFLRRRHL